MSFEELVYRAAKATVIVRKTNNLDKEKSFTTGFVVGQCRGLCIIITIGHFLSSSDSDRSIEIVFFGHPDEVFGATVQFHVPEAEILLLTVEKRDEIETGKLIFESADNWGLRYLELIVSVSHPCALRWRAALGIINCPEYLNTDIEVYDSQMILFDHSLQLGVGSSGAALINKQGNVVGIQSGEMSATYLAMSGQPVSDALDSKISQTDLSFELLAVYIAELVYGYRHIHTIKTISCDLKQAVHIKYIDKVLRNLLQRYVRIDVSKVSLNDLIEQYISTIPGVSSFERKLRVSVPPSSQPTCSHAFDPPQGTILYDVLSRGASKADESALDSEGKSNIAQSWRIAAAAAAAAKKWNNYGDAGMNRFDSLPSCDGLGVSKGNSRIVESWKIANAAWNTFKEKAAGGAAGGLSTKRFCRDPYEVLNMSREVSEKDIKAAYRKLDIKFHPEKNGSNPEASEHFKVKVFTLQLYVHTFVQSTFNVLSADKVRGSTLVVSGDGCYYSKDAIQIIIKMAAANGVRRVWVGQNGLLSTPAVSAVIRERVGADGSKASGAFILTASHNPGGPIEDVGIKYNMDNGGPAPEGITDKIYENTKTIKEYLIAEGLPDVDISVVGVTNFEGPEGQFDVDVFDSTSDYVKLMKSIFNFQSIQKLVESPQFSFCYDALHGVAGAYAKRIFVEELGAQESSLLNCEQKDDFGRGHPDPNLNYAKELVARMGLGKSQVEHEPPEFGAAADGDADRNMVLGKRFFVTPSDSVAVIAANAVQSIPYFSSGLKGVARSMLTSAALDVVAKHLNLKFFEVPTGWKFFGNLMDAGVCSVYGQESFGAGSDHIREKDGIWAVLAWLSILAYKNKENLGGGKLVTVEDIVRQHWATYGRHYFTRYDYENVDAGAANELMAYLVKLQSSLADVNNIIKGTRSDMSKVVNANVFGYQDLVDGSISKHQGVRYLFEDGSRLVFILFGTVSKGAVIRLCIEQYENDSTKIGRDSQEALVPLVDVALKLSKMQEFIGRSAPTAIT